MAFHGIKKIVTKRMKIDKQIAHNFHRRNAMKETPMLEASGGQSHRELNVENSLKEFLKVEQSSQP